VWDVIVSKSNERLCVGRTWILVCFDLYLFPTSSYLPLSTIKHGRGSLQKAVLVRRSASVSVSALYFPSVALDLA
jgi:hypothetical protein